MNWKAQKQMVEDVEKYPELYEAFVLETDEDEE